jgi:hypothetical protein
MSHAPFEESGAPRDPRIDDRVVRLLGEQHGAMAFNGLRRSLGVHPETLTRALRRLERYGVVEHASMGYRLVNGDGEESPPNGSAEAPIAPSWRGIAEVQLAPGIDGRQLLGLLAGRWAGQLRWIGLYEREDEPLLVWSRADGPGHVLLGFRNGSLRVYAEPVDGAEVSPELGAAARDLLVYALERIRNVRLDPPAGNLTTFLLYTPAIRFGAN